MTDHYVTEQKTCKSAKIVQNKLPVAVLPTPTGPSPVWRDSVTTRVPLTRGRYALVDDLDAAIVEPHSWHCTNYGYAATRTNGRIIMMHNLLITPDVGKEVDHISGNTLDNRRANLRLVTHRQNTQNARAKATRDGVPVSSTYKGVAFFKRSQVFRAYINVDNRQFHLGYYDSEERAGLAYDQAARLVHGEYAKLNFPHRKVEVMAADRLERLMQALNETGWQ